MQVPETERGEQVIPNFYPYGSFPGAAESHQVSAPEVECIRAAVSAINGTDI